MYLVAFALNSFYVQEVTWNNVKSSIAIPDVEIILATASEDIARNFKNLIKK